MAVADAFDSITFPRACRLRGRRERVPYAVAAHEIEGWSGRQFDPRVVESATLTARSVGWGAGASPLVSPPPVLVPLSAQTAEALNAYAEKLAA